MSLSISREVTFGELEYPGRAVGKYLGKSLTSLTPSILDISYLKRQVRHVQRLTTERAI